MVKDCLEYTKRCQACQFHANFIHQSPKPLHPMWVEAIPLREVEKEIVVHFINEHIIH
ncbi:unnamed protein product [Malus baccata var. baccata]